MCDICGYINGHHTRCPNYTPPKPQHYCSICGEGIFDGDEYIENSNGEFRHYDCFFGLRELLEWLGYKVKRMDNENEKVY